MMGVYSASGCICSRFLCVGVYLGPSVYVVCGTRRFLIMFVIFVGLSVRRRVPWTCLLSVRNDITTTPDMTSPS
jgi:hypothetical protein